MSNIDGGREAESKDRRGQTTGRTDTAGVGRKRVILAAVASAVLLVAGVAVLMLVPERILFGYRLHFSILELDRDRPLHSFDYRTADGLTLRSWYVVPRDGRATIVYFAGRDGDIIHKPAHLVEPVEAGYGLLLVGYRGYGGNPGFPGEAAIQRDMLALLDQARNAGITANGTILYGYSMGSAFAVHAAAFTDPLGVVLEAPISTFLAAVRLQVGPVPAMFVRTRFDNVARVPAIRAPILLLAGGRDTVTPPSFAHALANASPTLTTVEVIAEANHFNIIRLGGYRAVREFLEGLEASLTIAESLSPRLQSAAFSVPLNRPES